MKILLIGNNFFNYTSALYQAFSELNNEAALCILKDNWIATPAGQPRISSDTVSYVSENFYLMYNQQMTQLHPA